MENEVERFPILRFSKGSGSSIEEVIARECALTIILNNHELVTLLCSPMDMKYLAVGFLLSEGLLKSKDEIKKMTVDDRRGVVRLEAELEEGFPQGVSFKRLITSSGGRGVFPRGVADATDQKVQSQMRISTDEILALVDEFRNCSQLYLATHGVHSAALCDRKGISVFSEDIGRHNAIDKVFGKCLLEDIPTDDRLVITSGRISSDTVHKVARRGIPTIISIAVPTNLAVRIAHNLGITLVGDAMEEKMNVYTNKWRIVPGEE